MMSNNLSIEPQTTESESIEALIIIGKSLEMLGEELVFIATYS